MSNIIPPVNEQQETKTENILEIIWPEALTCRLESELYLALVTRKIGKEHPKTKWFRPTQRDAFYREALAKRETHDVYFTPNLFRHTSDGLRRKTENAAAWGSFYLDIDCIPDDNTTGLDDKGKRRLTMSEAREFLTDVEHEPTIVVNSGRGLHAYWTGQEPRAIKDANRVDECAFHRSWFENKAAWVFNFMDEAVIDPCYLMTQLLRVPGTLNHKAGGPYEVAIDYRFSYED